MDYLTFYRDDVGFSFIPVKGDKNSHPGILVSAIGKKDARDRKFDKGSSIRMTLILPEFARLI